ncbi:MAG: phosphocholine cytidylyltransferase family protein [Chloroflexota bacterium]|nr:phosphocholine cytidylyltransferase family protein [Chloroflexota bacterium]
MKAIILAAGAGNRLQPYSSSKPKCLVEIAGQSLLQRQIETIRSNNIDDITIITGYMANKINIKGTRIFHNPGYARTNMVSTLFMAAEILNSGDPVIVSYGDIIYQTEILRRVISCDAPICLPVDVQWERYWSARMPDPLSDVETLKLNTNGDVIELGKKPNNRSEIQGQYIGLMKFNASLAGQLTTIYNKLNRSDIYDGKDFDNMYMTTFLQILINRKCRAKAIKIENGWLEVDTPEDLELYHSMHRDGSLSRFIDLSA